MLATQLISMRILDNGKCIVTGHRRHHDPRMWHIDLPPQPVHFANRIGYQQACSHVRCIVRLAYPDVRRPYCPNVHIDRISVRPYLVDTLG
jgi:hypothetical protein